MVQRRIVGFDRDEDGDWRAHLECRHRQHVRHRPPFRNAPWVEVDAEREQRIGRMLDCPLCDRCELPDGLEVVRTTAVWDEHTLPDRARTPIKDATDEQLATHLEHIENGLKLESYAHDVEERYVALCDEIIEEQKRRAARGGQS